MPYRQPAPIREEHQRFTPATDIEVPKVERTAKNTSPPQGLTSKDIVHGFEYEKERYVQFEAEELAKIAPRNSPDMSILEFVRFSEIDPVYLETSYYVLPDVGGDKPYALLFETLKKTGYAAIGEMVMHRRDQILVLRPGKHGLISHTLFHEDEVKRENEYHVATGTAGGKEMDFAIKLVEALAGKFEPGRFKDRYRDRLQQVIVQKVESGAITQPEIAATKGPVIDIMAALKESLTRIKKPVASESTKPVPKQSKRAGGQP
jgi:DNA end-binding protein Ku